jgi:hypothetical protein
VTLRGPLELANVHEPTKWVAFPLRILHGIRFFWGRVGCGSPTLCLRGIVSRRVSRREIVFLEMVSGGEWAFGDCPA